MTGENTSRDPGGDGRQIDRLLVRGSIALAALAVVLTVDAVVRGRSEFDFRLIRIMQEIDLPHLGTVLHVVSDLTGSFWAVTLWTALLLYLAVVLRSWLPAITVALIPLGGAVNWVIGQIVARPRPDSDQLLRSIDEVDLAAFPSGEVVGAVIFYGVIFLLAGNIPFASLRIPVQAVAVVVILLSGPASIWLGAHWVSDVFMAYVLGFSILLALIWFYRVVAAAAGDLPFIHAAVVPVDPAIPQAHALTSTILFQDNVVTKIYAPGFVPRAVYWLSFQAEFPYIRNRAALEAAVLRRNLAGMLTEYWYGSNRVARAFGIVEVNGRLGLASDRIEIGGEQDSDAEIEFLYDLCDRFDEAGLPTWQVDPRQPRGKDNVLQGKDGRYYIVDLESGLASPLASPRAWWRAVERADVPLFDTVYFDITRSYIERMSEDMKTRMGDDWYDDLLMMVDRAEEANTRWHASEPRIWSRMLRWIESGFGIGRLIRRIREASRSNRTRAENLLAGMVETWEVEGRIDQLEANGIRRTLAEPQIHRVIPHFAIHLTIGIAMRFPVGSILRASYTLLNLLATTIRLLTRKIDRAEWRRNASIHSPLVVIVAGMPAIGTFSYLLSGPVRSNHLLMRMVADTMLLKFPGRLYERLGWRALIARPAGSAHAAPAPAGGADALRHTPTRRLVIILGAVGAALIAGNVLLQILSHAIDPRAVWLSNLAAHLNVDAPGSLSTWYAVILLAAAGFLASIAAGILWAQNGNARLQLGALAIIALGLAFEEHLPFNLSGARFIREIVTGGIRDVGWPSSLLWIAGIAIAIVVGYRFAASLPLPLRGLLVIGVALFAGGAIGVEIAGALYRSIFTATDFEYQMIASAEELAEMIGIAVVLYVVLEFARTTITAHRSRLEADTTS